MVCIMRTIANYAFWWVGAFGSTILALILTTAMGIGIVFSATTLETAGFFGVILTFMTPLTTLGTGRIFEGRTAKIILSSTNSSSARLSGYSHQAHSGFILHDCWNASTAISGVTSSMLSNVLIRRGTPRTRYFAHFSFLSAQ